MTDLIEPPARRIHQPLRFQMTGLHRGGLASLPALGRLAKNSLRHIEAVAIDPYPGRASEYRDAAKKHGLSNVEPVEARYEDLVLDRGFSVPDLHVLQPDDARTSLVAVEHAAAHGYAVSGLVITNLPRLGLTAFRYSGGRGDAFESQRQLLGGLADVTSGLGSDRFWGSAAPLTFRRSEGGIRRWYNEYLERDVGRLLGGLRPTASAIESTATGRVTRPVVVLEGDVLDDDPSSVARRVEESASFPLRREQPFTVIEIAREPEPTLRFRNGVIRRDHLLQVGRADDVTKSDMRRQAELALAASQRPERRESRGEGSGGAGLLLGLALGFALGAALAGNATRRAPVDLTD